MVYVLIHKGFNEIADLFTKAIVTVSGEKNYNNNVDSVFQAIIDSSTQNIDDPNIKMIWTYLQLNVEIKVFKNYRSK